jgi:protein-S-isoprenylcysteine O-methyltransferase Ste14
MTFARREATSLHCRLREQIPATAVFKAAITQEKQMSKLAGVLLSLLAGNAFALEEQAKTTATTWEIYVAVLVVLVGGFIWVYILQKKEKERQERKGRKSSS